MKKILFFFSLLGIVVLSAVVKADSSGNGRLQLDPNVITNSNAGSGSGNISNTGQLFSPELTEKTTLMATNLQKTVEVKSAIQFNANQAKSLNSVDNEGTIAQLFKDYKPQGLFSNDEASSRSSQTGGMLLTAGIGLPLIILAAFMGIKRSQRKSQRQS